MFPIGDTIPRRHPAIATWTLIFINGVIFLFELMMPQPELDQFFRLFGMVPARFTHPGWAFWAGFPIDDCWPVLSSMFLHGGWLHIIGNMWALWIFGDNVEDRMGPVRFIIFYLICGVAAGIVHCLVNPDSTVPTVGASGAIAGVMGAYFYLFPRARVIVLLPVFFLPLFFELPAVFYLGFWMLIQIFSGASSLTGPRDVGSIAWWAHVGGFTTGLALQFLFVRRRPVAPQPWRDQYGVDSAWVPNGYWRI